VRFGSVCSGIEAASVAWHPLGWQAAWLSEIEPFPSAVLAHHYPDVHNLGDMTTLPERILSGEVEAPDLFCGGTPCQAFSVAGLRNSLDDARGNLSLTFVGIANAIDHVRSVRRDDPGIIFWENVPGVLSTKDNAFGCFLGALAGEDEPIIPSGEKWTNAGCVYGPQRAVAWRVLDAQYFGVAQRRRRVFVVASARADFDPAKILFEFDSVRRDTAPSREKGQAIAPCVTNGPPFSRTGNERVEAEAVVVSRSHWDGDYPHPTLNQSAKGSGGVGSSNQEIFSQRGAYLAPQPVTARMVAFGEYSIDGTASAMKARDYKDATDLVAQPMVVHGTQDPCVSDIAFAQGRNNGGENVLMQPVAYSMITANTGSNGLGVSQEIAPTLDRAQPAAVAQPINIYGGNKRPDRPEGGFYVRTDEDTSKTLDAATGLNPTCSQGGTAVMQSMQVRRLTPVECERLQGFPDGYTNIAWRKKAESPDGPRYKALGNSWAVPVVAWIGHRIQQEINK
jgi:site-specific DNA-cytosine methylase